MGAIELFKSYRDELDYKHNLYENIVKKSRDITVHSKKLIFHLHRLTNVDDKIQEKLLREAYEKVDIICGKWKEIAELLKSDDSNAYARAYSAGLQEFIEAMEFLNFFTATNNKTQSSTNVLGLEKIKDILCFKICNNDDEQELTYQIYVSVSDYLLGIADVTGEAMRMCISTAALATSKESKISNLCACNRTFSLLDFINLMYSAFNNFSSVNGLNAKLWRDKLNTMSASLQKVENTCYTLRLQQSEIIT